MAQAFRIHSVRAVLVMVSACASLVANFCNLKSSTSTQYGTQLKFSTRLEVDRRASKYHTTGLVV